MRLLDMNDLAVMMQCSLSHVRQNIIKANGFPSPILLPGGAKRPLKRWDEDEVASFLRALKAAPRRPAKGNAT